MKRKELLNQTLQMLIQQTERALDEGWIYTDEFRSELEKARKVLSDKKESSESYPTPSPSFHVIQQ